MLRVLAEDGIGDHRFNRAGEIAIQAIDQYGVDGGPFKNGIGLTLGRVEVDLSGPLGSWLSGLLRSVRLRRPGLARIFCGLRSCWGRRPFGDARCSVA